MRVFRNLKIGYKIVGTLLLTLAFTALVGWVGLFFLGEMNTRLNNIVDISTQKVRLASSINEYMLDIGLTEKNIILVTTENQATTLSWETDQSLSELQDNLNELKQLADPNEQTVLDQFDKAWLEYTIINKEIQELAHSDSDHQAFVLSEGGGRQLFQELGKTLDGLTNKYDADLARAEKNNDFDNYVAIVKKHYLVDDTKLILYRLRQAEKNLILARAPAEIDDAYNQMDEERVAMVYKLDELNALTDPQELELVDGFSTTYTEWQSIQHQIRKLALANTTQNAIDISQGKGRTAFIKAATSIGEITRITEAALTADKINSNNDFRLASQSMVIVAGVAIIVGLIMGIFVSRAISKNVHTMVEAAETIARFDLQNLVKAATAVAGGNLKARSHFVTSAIPVRSKDEMGELAVAFNLMVSSLNETGQAFDKMTANLARLEEQVADRTRRLEVLAVLGERLSAILDVNRILIELVNQVKENFGYYHSHIYLLDNAGEMLVMAEGAGTVGIIMKSQDHRIPLAAETSLVARAARSGRIVRVDNVRLAKDWLPNDLLPDTFSEMAVPIFLEERVVGVLDVQEDRIAGFDGSDETLLRSLANLVSVALRNANLFADVQQALSDAHESQLRYREQAWQQNKLSGYAREHVYTHRNAPFLAEDTIREAEELAISRQQPAFVNIDDLDSNTQSIVAPVLLGGQNIGSLQLHQMSNTDSKTLWTEQDLNLISAVLDQVAQAAENLRLFDETKERATRQQVIREINDKLRATPNLEVMLETAARELGQRLGVPHVVVELGIDNKARHKAVSDVPDNGLKHQAENGATG